MTNEWHPVPGEPAFRVSADGRVQRFSHKKKTPEWRDAATYVNSIGYLCTSSPGKRNQPVLVHRLVALAFLGPAPSDLHQVAHNDGSRDNCHPSNLRWATVKENAADRRAHGTQQIGEQQAAAKLTKADIPEIRLLAAQGMKQRDIARQFGVHQSTVWRVLHAQSWCCVEDRPVREIAA